MYAESDGESSMMLLSNCTVSGNQAEGDGELLFLSHAQASIGQLICFFMLRWWCGCSLALDRNHFSHELLLVAVSVSDFVILDSLC